MIDRLPRKDAKPEKYDINMRRNDVYDVHLIDIHYDALAPDYIGVSFMEDWNE